MTPPCRAPIESVVYSVRSEVGSYDRLTFGKRLVLLPDTLEMVGVALPDAVPAPRWLELLLMSNL